MAWNDPVFHYTGDVVTAADYNHRYYNERYLKGKDGAISVDASLYVGGNITLSGTVDGVDIAALNTRVDAVSASQPSRVFDTTYQNTSGKTVVVTVVATMPASETVTGYCDANSTPTTKVARISTGGSAGATDYHSATFIVPPSYYYKVVKSSSDVLVEAWTEWTLH